MNIGPNWRLSFNRWVYNIHHKHFRRKKVKCWPTFDSNYIHLIFSYFAIEGYKVIQMECTKNEVYHEESWNRDKEPTTWVVQMIDPIHRSRVMKKTIHLCKHVSQPLHEHPSFHWNTILFIYRLCTITNTRTMCRIVVTQFWRSFFHFSN